MARMIRQDIDKGLPTVVIDPHGDLFNEINDGLSDDQRQRAQTVEHEAEGCSQEGSIGMGRLGHSHHQRCGSARCRRH